jgi:hypothetical protein
VNVFNWRSLTASGLSLWLGVLVCLLGCARPASAAAELRTSVAGAVSCPDTDGAAEDSCCQHGHNPTSPESNHRAMSCCPTETALIQKQSIAPALTHVFVAVLALLNVDASNFVFASASVGDGVPWQAGRDILRQVHVLRI